MYIYIYMYMYIYVYIEQGHAARNDPAQFDLFSSISVCSFATLPGFCDIRILTWLAFLVVFASLCSRFHEFTVVEAFIFCPHTLKKNEVFVFFTCKSLPTCQVLSISHPWPHCISTQNCICNLESFDSSLDWRNFWTPIPLEYFFSN